jgi:hypothetical protein
MSEKSGICNRAICESTSIASVFRRFQTYDASIFVRSSGRSGDLVDCIWNRTCGEHDRGFVEPESLFAGLAVRGAVKKPNNNFLNPFLLQI